MKIYILWHAVITESDNELTKEYLDGYNGDLHTFSSKEKAYEHSKEFSNTLYEHLKRMTSKLDVPYDEKETRIIYEISERILDEPSGGSVLEAAYTIHPDGNVTSSYNEVEDGELIL